MADMIPCSRWGDHEKKIAARYIAASPIGKKQIIGSIFAEKLIFSENKFRTTAPNIILELISKPLATLKTITPKIQSPALGK
ncbi:hypothetical protein [Chitinophaga sp. CF418]|uniref:hypothetical protein n=1 Tax=Chitinophaga sp. CF418 TaxID=1855287 RepID=UPI001CB87AA1|nr:hypothetical protein [Chitinophaga sp. CF418]